MQDQRERIKVSGGTVERLIGRMLLPAPKHIEGGGYAPWLAVCRGFERPSFGFEKLERPEMLDSYLNLIITHPTQRMGKDAALRLLAWADRLVGDLALMPANFEFNEHGMSRRIAEPFDPARPLTLAMYVDVLHHGPKIETKEETT